MRRSIYSLLAVLFVLRSLVPAGFMLGAQPGQTALTIVVCTGHGIETLSIDPVSGLKTHHSSPSPKETCPYAPASAVAASYGGPDIRSVDVRYETVVYKRARERARASIQPAAHSARGPPPSII